MVTFATVDTLFETARVVLPSGVTLNYVHGGPADGPAVVMLHGITDSSFSFSRVMPLLSSRFRVIALDQRGHGDSDRPLAGYTMDDFAGDVLGLLDALRISTATLVGHSMGSFVARVVAEHAPHRVKRLVLIGTALSPRTITLAELAEVVARLEDPVDVGFIREFQASTVARPIPAEFFERVVAESRKVPARVWRDALGGLLDFRPRWPITCPTTILGGDRDAVFDESEQSALFFATEHSTFHLEPGVGHTLHWEAPERFVQLAFSGLAA